MNPNSATSGTPYTLPAPVSPEAGAFCVRPLSSGQRSSPYPQVTLQQLTDSELMAHANRVADQTRLSDSFEADEAFMEVLMELSRREQAGELPLAF